LVGFAAAPSTLQQSFQGKCVITTQQVGIPAGNIVPLVIDRGNDQDCNGSFPQASAIATAVFGSLVIEDGTIGTLVVVADSTTANNLVCKDLVSTGAVTDGQFVTVWYRPSDHAVLMFSNTTAIAPTCTLNVPAGDLVTRISAQFIKS
jgi:hypothetical protein